MTWLARGRWPIAAAGTLIALAATYVALRPAGARTVAYETAPLARGDLRTSISATGTMQAVLTVQVGSQVTGRIQSLHADFNSIVRRGQVIARIDPATYEATLVRARADREDARAGVTTARAALVNQTANLEAAHAAHDDTVRVYARNEELARQGVASTRDLEAAEVARSEAAARVKQAEAQVESARAAIEQAEARVKQAEAQVRLAEVNLDYTVIASPVDGVVVSRNVDVGQTVSASLQAPTLFVIANDLTRMQVVANVDEADIGSIGADAEVAFSVDSFPGEFFHGAIDQIRLNPVVTQNVVTYSVIINVANPDLKLRPGMTANTTFTVAESKGALKVPNAALRFWPSDVPRDREQELIRAAGADAPGGGRREGARAAPASGNGDPGGSPIASAEGVLRFPQTGRARWRARVLWVRGDSGAPEPRVVRVGITDGTASELDSPDLKEGDLVITGVDQPQVEARPNNPFGGGQGRPRGVGR